MSAEDLLKLKEQFKDNELNYNFNDPAYLRMVYPKVSKPKRPKSKSSYTNGKIISELNRTVRSSRTKTNLLESNKSATFLILGAVLGIVNAINKFKNSESDLDLPQKPYFPETDKNAKIKNKIIEEANNQGVSPSLALALAEQESNFNQGAVNKKSGAVGIMQLTPIACKQIGVDFEKVKTDANLNIKTGVAYLKWCLKNTNNEKEALVAYNAGIGNLRKAKKSGKDIDSITDKGSYAKSVLERKQKFNKIKPSSGLINKGNYYLKSDEVELSPQMEKYLSEINGSFVATSGMEKTTKHKGTADNPKSHYSGNKVDIRVWDVNDEQLIERIYNFLKHPATTMIALEFENEREADKIIKEVLKRYPNLAKNRITKYKLDKGNGNHLDILIDPNYYTPESTYSKSNRLVEKAKETKSDKNKVASKKTIRETSLPKNINIDLKDKKPSITEPYNTKISALDIIRNSKKNYKKF